MLENIDRGQSKMDNPEKLATQGTQDEEKQNKNNPEKLATQGTQDEERQNKDTIQYVQEKLERSLKRQRIMYCPVWSE